MSSIRLRELIATLPRDNDENWTSDGRPRVDAVSRMAGRDVTRKEINLAMGSDFVR